MKTYEESENYNPSEWEKYSVFYTTYFTYQWGIVACDRIVKTKAAKELLEMIKTVKFDVIVHDITLDECLYGLWEVKIKQSLYSNSNSNSELASGPTKCPSVTYIWMILCNPAG